MLQIEEFRHSISNFANLVCEGSARFPIERIQMNKYGKPQITAAVTAALPRIAGDTAKIKRWVALFAGWLAPSTGTATTITAPTTGTASNVARRAWKNRTPEKGTVSVPLTRWIYSDLLVKQSTATPTVASLRVSITQAVDKIVAALPDTDGTPEAAVSVDPHGEGVIVTAYWHDLGKVRDGG